MGVLKVCGSLSGAPQKQTLVLWDIQGVDDWGVGFSV